MRAWLLFVAGLVLLVVPWALRTYLLMPFPGSQELESLAFARALHQARLGFLVLGALLALAGAAALLARRPFARRHVVVVALLAVTAAALAWLRSASADEMFRPPERVTIVSTPPPSLPPTTLVLGVVVRDRARAYPIRLLAYHHFVEDEIAGEPVLPTYCTMCRTGSVYRPVVNGARASFRLVGASHRDAVLEDRATRTWWYQATGEARVGPLAGQSLPEIPSEQVTLATWMELHPDSDVMAPDAASEEGYRMFGFDEIDARRPDETKPAEAPGGPREWVVVVRAGEAERAYPWSALTERQWIEDEIGDVPVVVVLHGDGISFRAFDRRLDGRVLSFDRDGDALVEDEGGTAFGFDGVGRGGTLDGLALERLDAEQLFGHAFEQFHPDGTRYSAD